MNAVTPMPKYVCHKTVHALKIVALEIDLSSWILIPEDRAFLPLEVTQEWCRKHEIDRTKLPGYYVVYEDGYTSWSPIEAFEKGYTLIDRVDPTNAERAKAWGAVWDKLREINPKFGHTAPTGLQCALNEIDRLAKLAKIA